MPREALEVRPPVRFGIAIAAVDEDQCFTRSAMPDTRGLALDSQVVWRNRGHGQIIQKTCRICKTRRISASAHDRRSARPRKFCGKRPERAIHGAEPRSSRRDAAAQSKGACPAGSIGLDLGVARFERITAEPLRAQRTRKEISAFSALSAVRSPWVRKSRDVWVRVSDRGCIGELLIVPLKNPL